MAARQRSIAEAKTPPDSIARARVNGTARAEPSLRHPGQPAGVGFTATRFCEIDLEDVQQRGFLLPDSGRSQLAQEMRRIKRPLLLNIQKAQAVVESAVTETPPGPPANLIMITSALPGEGKTFTAINLAMSVAAEVDRRVLLVDADVARSDVSRQLGITSARGLSDLLQETNHLFEDAVLTTNVERLSILPAGAPSEQVDELFASELMGSVVLSLADADPNRVVIFDASPLLATTEAAVLARYMGQTVVVVEAGKTPQDAVSQAIAQLEGCSNVSLVLNKTSGKDTSGYGYGYGYGADGSSDREARASDAG
jgi:receptor protein-tyrosine kinase